MSQESIAADIGRAWRSQRDGKPDAAISDFDRILKQDANNIDANYGMGLAQRDAGHRDEALKYFARAHELVEAAVTDRNHTPGERNAPEDDRYMMLGRMLQQRLSELNTGMK